MGYLFAAPVGCGKNHLLECIAGEADIPVLVINNFREKWVGSTEGNVENIFRLIRAVGQCIIFIDEADQMLGKRNMSSDSPVDARVYSMFASFMGDSRNQGKAIWVLASSRPDQIEVDFKRPGRVDIKIPIFPALTPADGYFLLRSLAKRHGLALPATMPAKLPVPDLLTPGAAKAITDNLARQLAIADTSATKQKILPTLTALLKSYIPPVPLSVLAFQMQLAVNEASDATLIPAIVYDKIKTYSL
jgi:hypothetical protein